MRPWTYHEATVLLADIVQLPHNIDASLNEDSTAPNFVRIHWPIWSPASMQTAHDYARQQMNDGVRLSPGRTYASNEWDELGREDTARAKYATHRCPEEPLTLHIAVFCSAM